MKSSRTIALVVFAITFVFNEWAFRFIFPLKPIDSFLRSMTLVLDGFLLMAIITLLWQNTMFGDRLKRLMQNHPKKLMVYIGSFLSFCLLMSVEFSCRYYFKHIYKAPYSEQTFWGPSAVVADPILGSRLPRDTVISHRNVVNDSLIYEQHYRTDEFCRRINPSLVADTSYRQFVMVTGCSFAFGYGLNERQTLSFYLDSLSGRRGYNYGVSGHGTQQTLTLLRSRDLHTEITEPNGVLVHLFIDDHIPRLIGSRRLIKLWAGNYPYYYLDGDELKRDGSFLSGRPVLSRLYLAISQSAFIDLFDIDLPWYAGNAHMKLFGAVLREAKKEFLDQYPEGRFVVAIAPGSKLAPRVKAVLDQNNVEVLDLSGLLNKEDRKYRIHWTEAHPNGLYYLEVAKAITAYLGNR